MSLLKYENLIEGFVNEDISVDEFEHLYLTMFKNEGDTISDASFEILNKLFSDIDVYCGDESLMSADDIDEDQLRACAQISLQELKNL